MYGYTRNVNPERMAFHARVGQPAMQRIGLSVPLSRQPAVPSGGTSVPGAFHGVPAAIAIDKEGRAPGRSSGQAGLNSQTARGFGFPIPGLQDPSPESVVGNDYFVRENEFEEILDDGEYDYIVIGSSFMALAFIQAAREINANIRILVLERGRMWLPSHFQNLPLPFRLVLGGRAETFPWTLSEQTFYNPNVPGLTTAFLRGSCPFFGGKSTVWSAWSPNPSPDRFRGFPPSMKATMGKENFWPKVNEMLNVRRANEIGGEVFSSLQDEVDKVLQDNILEIPSAISSEPARLAVGPNHRTSSLRFTKYSVPGPLLSVVEQVRKQLTTNEGSYASKSACLNIVTDCVVQRLGALQKNHVRSVETSRGTLSFMSHKTKIILCAGVIPNTTLVLNSFPHQRGIAGSRLTGHSMSHFTARVAREALGQEGEHLRIAANYLHGENKAASGTDADPALQYHIQITAIYCPNPKEQIEDLARECPDFAAAPTPKQLESSTDKVVFVCATLGELEERKLKEGGLAEGGKSRVDWSGGPDPTTNVTVHYEYTERDKQIWDIFDEATLQALKVMSKGYELEYWHEGINESGTWEKSPPPKDKIRIPGVVHEASTLFMGSKEEGGSVDDQYLLHGTDNVYVTGAALFPTCGSWNPTPAMCGFARDLATKIVPKPGEERDNEF